MTAVIPEWILGVIADIRAEGDDEYRVSDNAWHPACGRAAMAVIASESQRHWAIRQAIPLVMGRSAGLPSVEDYAAVNRAEEDYVAVYRAACEAAADRRKAG